MPKSNAKLKTLPLEIQREMWRLRTEPVDEDGRSVDPSDGSAMTQKKVLSWLKREHGVSSSTGAFSVWEDWFPVGRQVLEVSENTDKILDAAKSGALDFSSSELMEMGQKYFSAKAIGQDDPKVFLGLLKVFEKAASRRLDERRVKLLEEKERKLESMEKKARELKDGGGLSDETLEVIEKHFNLL